MKKLMIAACAVALAGVAQAVSCNWNVVIGEDVALMLPNGDSTYTGTAYVYLMSDTVTQENIWNSIQDGTKTLADWTPSATFQIKDGVQVNDVDKNYARITVDSETTAQTLFIVAKDGDNYFFAYEDELSGDTSSAGALWNPDYSWSGDSDYVYGNVPYTGDGGWYSAVPEPTSGLLLLLGVAGLALKRRRA